MSVQTMTSAHLPRIKKIALTFANAAGQHARSLLPLLLFVIITLNVATDCKPSERAASIETARFEEANTATVGATSTDTPRERLY